METVCALQLVVERTHDMEAIRKIACEPSAYRRMADDAAPKNPADWHPDTEHGIWLLAEDEHGPFGVFRLNQMNAALWETHVCMARRGYGEKSRKAFLEMLRWTWQNTSCRRLLGYISETNRLALKLALDSGMQQYGYSPRSWLKNGVLYGLILVGIDRPLR